MVIKCWSVPKWGPKGSAVSIVWPIFLRTVLYTWYTTLCWNLWFGWFRMSYDLCRKMGESSNEFRMSIDAWTLWSCTKNPSMVIPALLTTASGGAWYLSRICFMASRTDDMLETSLVTAKWSASPRVWKARVWRSDSLYLHNLRD